MEDVKSEVLEAIERVVQESTECCGIIAVQESSLLDLVLLGVKLGAGLGADKLSDRVEYAKKERDIHEEANTQSAIDCGMVIGFVVAYDDLRQIALDPASVVRVKEEE